MKTLMTRPASQKGDGRLTERLDLSQREQSSHTKAEPLSERPCL